MGAVEHHLGRKTRRCTTKLIQKVRAFVRVVMGPVYILNYFQLAGRAECARIMFHLAGVPFTDNQIPMSEWSKHKTDASRFPLGQMPTLQVDNEVICQSAAINRYLADEFQLLGESNVDRVLSDQIIATIGEVTESASKIRFDFKKDKETKKSELDALFSTDKIKVLLNFINDKVAGARGAFVLGDKVTMVDVVFLVAYQHMVEYHPDISTEYPHMATLYAAISNVEAIKKYLEGRKHALFF